jgi:hypothetical protein
MNPFRIAAGRGVTDPRGEVMSVETLLSLHLHDLGMADAEQMQGTPDRTGMHRLPKPVEHEHGKIQQGIHDPFPTSVGKLTKSRASAIEKLQPRGRHPQSTNLTRFPSGCARNRAAP